MTVTRRFSAYLLSFSFGFGVPLMALAAVHGDADQPFAHHTSSRMMAYQMDTSEDDMEALRARLWALTEHGGTEHCNVDGITAPCEAVTVFEEN